MWHCEETLFELVIIIYLSFTQEQRKLVSNIEMKVEDAAVHVQHGEMQLRSGQQLKSYVLPVGGAILGGFVGGIVAGPIGALAGLKVAALTAAAAGEAMHCKYTIIINTF